MAPGAELIPGADRIRNPGRERTEFIFAEKRDVTYSPLTVYIHDHL